MTDRTLRPIKIIDRSRCAGCCYYARKKTKLCTWDRCYADILMPDINASMDCPMRATHSHNRNPPNRDYKGYEYAVTQRYAKIIVEGINTRHFSYWGTSLYSPSLDYRSSNGEIYGWNLSTHHYGERNRIAVGLFGNVEGLYSQIFDITKAKILDGRLRLYTDPDPNYSMHRSYFFVKIIDAPVIGAPEEESAPISKIHEKGQKSLFDWCGVEE